MSYEIDNPSRYGYGPQTEWVTGSGSWWKPPATGTASSMDEITEEDRLEMLLKIFPEAKRRKPNAKCPGVLKDKFPIVEKLYD